MSGAMSFVRTLVRTPSSRRYSLVAGLTLAMSFVPMAGTLGYFSGLVLSPVLALLAAFAGADAVTAIRAKAPEGDEQPPGGLAQLARSGAIELSGLVGAALAMLVLGMLWTTNCDPLGGAAYFAVGPACSAALGFVSGAFMAVLVGPRRRGLTLLAAALPMLLSTVIGLRRLYVDPAVFAYDPFFGWFSGPIYDEGVAISSRYLSYRAYNFAAAAGVWLALAATCDAQLRPSWRRAFASSGARVRLSAATLLALTTLGLGLQAPRFGWSATIESLSQVLAATRETEHFIIHYGPTSITAREIDMVAADHEFAWARLEQRLGRAPTRKVHSFVFANGRQRGVLLGANQVEVSPPWRQQMYLSHRSWPHSVMPHELAHAFLGDFGDPVLGLPIAGLRFNGALIEGLPTALAPRPRDNLGLHEQAAILDRLDKRPPLTQIMGPGFWGVAASRAYTAAGSFVLWLAETRGWPETASLYDNAGDFEASFGEDLATLEAEWLAFIRALPLREQDVDAQAQRYARGSVFRRPCAHRAAELSAEAVRARLADDSASALELQRTLCRIEPEDPGHQLRLADMLAGWERFDEAATLLDALAARDDLTATIHAIIDEQRGDTALVAGRWSEAGGHYRAAMELGLDESHRRQLQIKLRATEQPELGPLVADYFGPFRVSDDSRPSAMLQLWTAAKIARLPGHHALGHYLLGRQFLAIAAPDEAAPALAEALAPPVGEPPLTSPELQRAALLAAVSARAQLRDWDGARVLLAPLSGLAEGEGHRAEIEDWRARVDFFERHFSTE